MNPPQEFWTAINSIALAVVAVIALFNRLAANKQTAVIKEAAVQQTAAIKQVQAAVDGPLSLALNTVAVLARDKADRSHKPEDIKAAEEAEAVVKNREEGKAMPPTPATEPSGVG